LPGGPVGSPVRWAATFNVKEEVEWQGPGVLNQGGGLSSDKVLAGGPEFLVSYATGHGAGLPN